ncbi:MAG: hypothetical protein JJE55_07060 [Flavobacteriaceae bacterium]|nr:hypothetical protein [Flavobacteriaceae bacterium]
MPQATATRFDNLTEVLRYAATNPSKFTAGERILINQERARLLAKLAGTQDDRKPFVVNAKIENKIREALAWINR